MRCTFFYRIKRGFGSPHETGTKLSKPWAAGLTYSHKKGGSEGLNPATAFSFLSNR